MHVGYLIPLLMLITKAMHLPIHRFNIGKTIFNYILPQKNTS